MNSQFQIKMARNLGQMKVHFKIAGAVLVIIGLACHCCGFETCLDELGLALLQVS